MYGSIGPGSAVSHSVRPKYVVRGFDISVTVVDFNDEFVFELFYWLFLLPVFTDCLNY